MTKIIEARKANVGKTGAKQIIKFENDNSYYQFRIELDSTSYKNFKVLKSLEDFNKLELIVLE